VEADTGNIGGANSHEFHVLAESGEDTIAYATDGPYAANLEKARSAPPKPAAAAGSPGAELKKVATPGVETIEAVAGFLEVAPAQTIKTLLVQGSCEPVVALILRGDHDLNALKAEKLEDVAAPLTFATEAEIQAATGCRPGSLGPIGLDVPAYVDLEAAALTDFVCGANEDGFHYTGANWERDRDLDTARVVDFRNVMAGDPAPDGQGSLQFLRGIEVGHIFQLGSVYSEPLGAAVLGPDGGSTTPIMGCYGMGVTRLVAAIIEQNHDEVGIIWPDPVAPYDLHIIALNYGKSEAVRKAADELYEACSSAGMEVLLDDRDERPGVKFAEADLIGIPRRITVGERGLKDQTVEYRHRRDSENEAVALDGVLDRLGS
jgi:prolyl-tRNA synthetase